MSRYVASLLIAAVGSILMAIASSTRADPDDGTDAGGRANDAIEIAAVACLSGQDLSLGKPAWEGMQLAVDEENAHGNGPRFRLKPYDEKSDPDVGQRVASEIAGSRAVAVLGSAFTYRWSRDRSSPRPASPLCRPQPRT